MNRLDDLQTDAFAARARAALDSSAEHLDFATLSKLNQARQRALEHSSEKSRATRWWLGLGSILGTATAAALVLAVYLHPLNVSEPIAPVALGDLEIVSSDEAELFENLAFYEWASVALESDDVPDQAG